PFAPKANNPKPIAITIKPIPYFTVAGGLYLESHILETKLAKVMIKKEFMIENHETAISEDSAVNSRYSIHNAKPQTAVKQITCTILESGALPKVFLVSMVTAYVTKINGTMVCKVLTTLKIVRELPDKLLSTLSRAKITKEEAPCSNDIQKKITKNAKMITAIKRSRTTLVYLANLEITTNRKMINAAKMATFWPAVVPT